MKLEEKNQYRLDLVSQAVYGSPKYLKLILEWNKITNWNELQAGCEISLPSQAVVQRSCLRHIK